MEYIQATLSVPTMGGVAPERRYGFGNTSYLQDTTPETTMGEAAL